jgi:hypothetical protein
MLEGTTQAVYSKNSALYDACKLDLLTRSAEDVKKGITATVPTSTMTAVGQNPSSVETLPVIDPVSFSISPPLPVGLDFDRESGAISGTPQRIGESLHILRAENSIGSDGIEVEFSVQLGPREQTELLRTAAEAMRRVLRLSDFVVRGNPSKSWKFHGNTKSVTNSFRSPDDNRFRATLDETAALQLGWRIIDRIFQEGGLCT